MPVSPSSSNRPPRRAQVTSRALCTALALALASWLGGCATVRPEEREYLAEPAMTFSAGGMTDAHEEHVLNNREGSFGGGSAKGGGCGCN